MAPPPAPQERKRRTAEKAVEDTWDYKMCKKIAQLTKVIYTLNCRTEDNEERMRWTHESHHTEIDRLIQEYEGKIAQISDKVKQVDSSKTACINALEENQKRMIEAAKTNLSERAEKMASELEKHKNAFSDAMKAESKKNADKLKSEMENLRKLKDAEAEQLVKEYNEKYNAMLLEQLNDKDAMEKELRDAFGKKVDKLTAELKVAKESLDDTTKKLAELKEQKKEKDLTIEGLKREGGQYRGKIDSLTTENEELKSNLEKERNANNSAHASENDLRNKINDLIGEIRSKDGELCSFKSTLEETQKKLGKADAECIALQNEVSLAETQRNAAQNELNALKEEASKLKQKCLALEDKISSLSSRANCSQADMENLNRELEKASAEIARLKDQLNQKEQDYKRKVDELTEKYEKKLRSEADKYAAEGDAQRLAEIERVRRKLETAHEEELEALRSAHKAELEWLRRENAEAVQRMEGSLKALQSQGGTLHEELKNASEKIADFQKELEQRERDYNELLEKHKHQMQTDSVTIQNLQKEIEALRSSGAESEDAQRQMITRMKDEMEEALKNLRVQHKKEIQSLNEEFDDRTAHQQREHNEELDALKREQEKALEEARRNASSALGERDHKMLEMQDMLNKKIQQLIADGKEKVAQLQSEIDRLKREMELALHESEHSNRKNSNELARLQKHLGDLNATLAERQRVHEKQLRDQKEAAEANLKKELLQLEKEHVAERNKMESAHQSTVQQLKAEQESEKESFQSKLAGQESHFKKLLAEANTDYSKKIEQQLQSMRNDNAKVMEELRSQHNKEVQALKNRIEESDTALRKQVSKTSAVEEDCKLAKDEIERLKQQMLEDRAQAEDGLRKAFDHYQFQQNEMMSQHQTQLYQLTEEHRNAVNKLNAQRLAEERSHNDVIVQLKEALKELQHKYDFRESRPEDVDLINKLMKENKEKRKELEKAYDDMKFFKLELINREENYNKVFNRKPVVCAASSRDRGPSTPIKAALSLPDIKSQSTTR